MMTLPGAVVAVLLLLLVGQMEGSVAYEPEGHTVPPHEAPQIAFGDFARFLLRLEA